MCDFEITQWVDYVRGMTAPAERGRMQRHLDEGCRECTAIVQFLGRVVAAAAGPPVPDDLVEGALRAFPAAPLSWLSLPKLAARLVFSSLDEPQPEGVRAVSPTHVHVMYEAGHYTVDIHVEPQPDSTEVVLVGQIADQMTPDRPPTQLPVFLRTPAKTVAEAVSNEFGEFSLVYRPQPNLRLSIPIRAEGKMVEFSLARILAGQL